MARVVHVIGNGDSASLYGREVRKGVKIACNQTPFEIPEKFATAIVDFKFMNAMNKGQLAVDGKWILGFRPKRYLEDHPDYHMKIAQQIREFYTDLPKYALMPGDNIGQGYTNWSCGHMAVHYAAKKLKADEVHMYGFDSIFDWNLRSFSDISLNSDRGNTNNNRLAGNWRPIWTRLWEEFKDSTQFILHHNHDKFKVRHGPNVSARVYKPTEASEEIKFDKDGLPLMNVSGA